VTAVAVATPAEDRQAHIAARRSFVEMKRCFMQAASGVGGPLGARLQRKVRASASVDELSPMRALVLGALARANERAELCRHLDSIVPDTGPETGFVPL
jgi:hypothetical protein